MHKILLIIQREYLTRVRKKSFIVMTILGPILMAALIVVPTLIMQMSDEVKTVDVLDETGWFAGKFESDDRFVFTTVTDSLEVAKKNLNSKEGYALLYIPATMVSVPSSGIIYSNKQVGIDLKGYINDVMTREVENRKLSLEIIKEVNRNNPGADLQMDTLTGRNRVIDNILTNVKTKVHLTTIRMDEEGGEKKSFAEASMVVGYIAGFLIYMFIFMFGTQVMRGVIEEKVSRIVEIIISSVKPFQLMMGKIIGIALVGLTQFLLWIVLTLALVSVAKVVLPETFAPKQTTEVFNTGSRLPGQGVQPAEEETADMMSGIMEALYSINFVVMMVSFLLYFLGGYLLYAAMFAAIGSAVDNEADTQQFMLPITIPLIMAIIMIGFIINNPDGPVAFWMSMIPLTSPVIMMVRIPFGVPMWEIALSLTLLFATFTGAVWMAGKIYRTGILMYGKKVNYRELWKWLRYSA